MKEKFTQEEREMAVSTSLGEIARRLGYTVVRKGHYQNIKEMDSLMIKNDRSWVRYSSGESGNQIDFMLKFGGCNSLPEAIHKICEMNFSYNIKCEEPKREQQKKEMQLPEKVPGKFSRLYAYLSKTRGISVKIIDMFVRLGIIYESKDYHNIVFCGCDKDGNVKFATQRGTASSFKVDVEGNDKSYGINVPNDNNDTVKVFEAGIDMMSYINITGDVETNKLALGGVYDGPLETFLKEHPNIKKIFFCLDNDNAAKKALFGGETERIVNGKKVIEITEGLFDKYAERGYEVHDECAKEYGKDYNENLLYYRKNCPEILHDNIVLANPRKLVG